MHVATVRYANGKTGELHFAEPPAVGSTVCNPANFVRATVLSVTAVTDRKVGTVDVPKSMLEFGGVMHTLKAHAICATCTECADYFADPEAVTLEQFATDARRFFIGNGWSFKRPFTYCPTCSEE